MRRGELLMSDKEIEELFQQLGVLKAMINDLRNSFKQLQKSLEDKK